MLELTSGFARCFGHDASEVLGKRGRSFASLISSGRFSRC